MYSASRYQSRMDAGLWRAVCVRIGIFSLFLVVLIPAHPMLAAILVPLLPLWMSAEMLRCGIPIFDYRVIYLLAHAFWLLTWNSASLTVQASEQPLRSFHSYGAYVVAVTLCSLAALLVPNIRFPSLRFPHAASIRKLAVIGLLTLSCVSFGLFAIHAISDYLTTLLVGPEVFMATMFFLATPANTGRRGIALFAIAFLTVADGLTVTVSRTAILLPVWCLGFSFFMRNYYFEKILSPWSMLLAAPFLAVLAILADGLKTAASIGLFGGAAGSNAILGILAHVKISNLLKAGLTQHNYLQTTSAAALYYFVGLDHMQNFKGQYFGILFFQLVSAFIPRQLFPGKPASDIVRLMFDRNQIELPSEYDPLFEKMGDAWITGAVFYSILPLLLYAVLAKASFQSKYPIIRNCGLATYVLNLVAIFITTRGPYIVIVWVGIPSLALAALIFVLNLRDRGMVTTS